MFLAHHIAVWLGIPTGVVIVSMLFLRKRIKELLARRSRQRQNAAQTTIRPGRSTPAVATYALTYDTPKTSGTRVDHRRDSGRAGRKGTISGYGNG